MIRFLSPALMLRVCIGNLATSQPNGGESTDPPKGQRVFYASHSLMWYVPDPLSELAAAAGIKGHNLVRVQTLESSKTIQHSKSHSAIYAVWLSAMR